MPLRKSDLYTSIWSAADVLRGGMDASQYKDFVFYGTGIPACIIVLENGDVGASAGAVFMVDASSDFRKDGPKNRLREWDIHRIVDVFWARREVAGYSRSVPPTEIAANNHNPNLPRYLDGQDWADRQDLEGHLRGGIGDRATQRRPPATVPAPDGLLGRAPTGRRLQHHYCRLACRASTRNDR